MMSLNNVDKHQYLHGNDSYCILHYCLAILNCSSTTLTASVTYYYLLKLRGNVINTQIHQNSQTTNGLTCFKLFIIWLALRERWSTKFVKWGKTPLQLMGYTYQGPNTQTPQTLKETVNNEQTTAEPSPWKGQQPKPL